MEEYRIELTVNDEKIIGTAKAEESLLKFLRRHGFSEVKCGCEKGECGTCTVILDKKAIKSCITLALRADHKEVWTVKGMEKLELGRKLQESFVNHGAIQCGFCTPGMILTAKDYLDKNPLPNREEIKKAISGNLCRCTGYKKIVDAIYDVAGENHKLGGDIDV
ncbi:MAG TPA: (2Fe-2S)-binding protein [Candidatus Atribacteria bacterium]|nr:(2Fe-2S)-binding protein [Candidatus Atribacteria bacterium]